MMKTTTTTTTTTSVTEMMVRMAGNNAWANLRLLRACAKLSKEEWSKEGRTSFFPSLPETLNHILIVDWYYVDALEKGGKGRSVFESDIPFPDLEGLTKAQHAVDRQLLAFTERLTIDSLGDKVHLDRPNNHVQVETVVDTLMHLFTHQIHHRGQAHAMLSGTSVAPPQLDEFFMSEELHLRKAELEDLGLPLR
jgi:uncharacterized damage-inducible protein DinB